MKYLQLLCFTIVLIFCKPIFASFEKAYTECPRISDNALRLACFDNYVEAVEESLVRRLTTDGPNMYGFAAPVSQPDLGDDSHLEFNISVKYPLFQGGKPGNIKPNRLLAIYNGRYDFYALGGNRYESSPIISREQNPGLALEWDMSNDRTHKFRLGLFHQSNGQTLSRGDFSDELGLIDGLDNLDGVIDDVVNLDGVLEPDVLDVVNGLDGKTQFRNRVDFGGEDFALAQVSRSFNYVQFRYQYSNDPNGNLHNKWRQFQIETRFYPSAHDEIFWDISDNSKIQDFDGLRIVGEQAFGSFFSGDNYFLARAEIKTGTSSLNAVKNVSSRLSLGLMLDNFLLSAFYFDGYGKEPSTYHLRTRYWGFGFELR